MLNRTVAGRFRKKSENSRFAAYLNFLSFFHSNLIQHVRLTNSTCLTNLIQHVIVCATLVGVHAIWRAVLFLGLILTTGWISFDFVRFGS